MIKISVIIPVYNGEKYLRRCLDSIAGQSLENLEIIIVDNASTDRSADVIQSFINGWSEKRKILFINEEKQGNSFARNAGMAIATGEYITFADQDDSLEPYFLETMYLKAKELDSDVLVSGCRLVDARGATKRVIRLNDSGWSPFRMSAPWAKLYKRILIEENHLQFLPVNKGEDVYFVFNAYNCAANLRTVPIVGYRWFSNPESFSHTEHRKINQRNSILPLYDALQTSLYPLKNIEKDYLEYYFIKLIVHETVFCANGKSFEEAFGYYEQLEKWIDLNYPDNGQNKYLGFTKPKGEEFKRRIFITWFWDMKKRKTVGKFLKAYTKIFRR